MHARFLAGSFEIRGGGLHTGAPAVLRVAPADDGLTFVRDDLGGARVPARLECAVAGPRRTALECGGVRVESVEHLLAALACAGVWRARLHLHGPEVPALDGSAAPFHRAALRASRPDGPAPPAFRVARPFRLRRGAGAVALRPAAGPLASLRVDVRGVPQRLRAFVPGRFGEISAARTFVLLEDVEALRREGLAAGGSLENAVVLGPDGPMNPGGLRVPDEPARHKLVDAFGDLALLGGPLLGHVVLVRPGHRLMIDALRAAIGRGAVVPA